MTGGALIVIDVIDAEEKAEEESSAPRTFRTWYESVFSWIAAFAYKGGSTWEISARTDNEYLIKKR